MVKHGNFQFFLRQAECFQRVIFYFFIILINYFNLKLKIVYIYFYNYK